MSIYINVQHTDTFNTLTANLTAVTQTGNEDFIITGIPQGTVSTTATSGTEIRLINAEQNNLSGTATMFVRIPAAAGTTPLAKLTRAAELLTASTVSGISVTATAHGTDDDAYLVIKPRNTTVNWTGSSAGAGSEWTGTVSETTLDEVSYKFYPDPREIVVTAAGVITAEDNNGVAISQATGEVLSVKRATNLSMTNDEDALPSYTK